uniref:Uncharacterized protein n=1 Tax=Sinocyclocheilus rhinocerous TaxID=307959 RepID=A0A673GH31_9TELE
TVTDCTHKEDTGESFYYIFFAGKNISSSRQFSVDNSLGLSDGLLLDSGDGCDFSINVRDLSEEAELVFCVQRLILMIPPELNIRNESRKLMLDTVSELFLLRCFYTRQIEVSITSAQCLHQLVFIFGLKKLMEDDHFISSVEQHLFHMMDALLRCSDLMMKDETEVMQSASSLSQCMNFTDLLRGFQFNTLLCSKVRNQMDDLSHEYQPRIGTGDEYSVFINVSTFKSPIHGQNNRMQSFSTPAHTSALNREQKLQWKAQVFLSDQKCSNSGVSCHSFPVRTAMLAAFHGNKISSLRLTCKNKTQDTSLFNINKTLLDKSKTYKLI